MEIGRRIAKSVLRAERKNNKSTGPCSSEKRRKISSRN